MARPLTRGQRLENAAFLRALRRTGNVRLAARTIGVAYGTLQHRRSRHPDFAQAWAVALVFAEARLSAGGVRGPAGGRDGGGMGEGLRWGEAEVPSDVSGKGPHLGEAQAPSDGSALPPAVRARIVSPSASPAACDPLRTVGGEPVVVRRRDGKLQMRRAQPGKLTKACEQAFLSALSATANVSLSAAAVGVAEAAFYRRRRRDPGFEREWRLALAEGYDRIELALLAGYQPDAFADDGWRHNDPPAIPPMTANQALQLLYLHQKEARLGGVPAELRRPPGESREAFAERLTLMGEHRLRRQREAFLIAEAERLADGKPTHFDWAPGELPDLAQVRGWSKASGRAGVDESRALFGGWRIADLKRG